MGPRKKCVFCHVFEGMEPEVSPYTGLVFKLQDMSEPLPRPNFSKCSEVELCVISCPENCFT